MHLRDVPCDQVELERQELQFSCITRDFSCSDPPGTRYNLIAIGGSGLSLLGVVRHLTEVERYWLTDVLLGEDSPDIYSHREAPDGDFELATPDGAPADLERYGVEVAQARRHEASVGSVDDLAKGDRRGQPVSLRWILSHLVEEYARHLGHMDLLRGAIDGRTGY